MIVAWADLCYSLVIEEMPFEILVVVVIKQEVVFEEEVVANSFATLAFVADGSVALLFVAWAVELWLVCSSRLLRVLAVVLHV